MPEVHVQGETPAISAPANANLLATLLDAGVSISHECGGNSICGTCRVELQECAGQLPSPNFAEQHALSRFRTAGLVRLACQIPIPGDLTVRVLDTGQSPEWDQWEETEAG